MLDAPASIDAKQFDELQIAGSEKLTGQKDESEFQRMFFFIYNS